MEEHPIVVSPLESRFFSLPSNVSLVEPRGSSPGITFPAGFLAGGIAAGLKQSGRLDTGVVAVAPEWAASASSAQVSTTNAFAAAPVIVSRTETRPGAMLAVIINSGNANACTGQQGLEVARTMQRSCAEALGIPTDRQGVASTGIIGVNLSAPLMAAAAAECASSLTTEGGASFARAIMTTDRFAKECALDVALSNGVVRLGACAKGAGMVSPAMATMLCVVTTDAVLGPVDAQDMLDAASGSTFNRVTVDGEMSTNDAVFLLASGASGIRPRGQDARLFSEALRTLLHRLALMMVADGEGATRVVRVRVSSAGDDETAVVVCRAVGDSPLVKTAVHGGDPNWGRVMSSAGAALPKRWLPDVSLSLCSIRVVEGAVGRELSPAEQESLAAAMRGREIEIDLDLGLEPGSSELYFADLGHEYISINAEYHT